jgi:hypothetical protein
MCACREIAELFIKRPRVLTTQEKCKHGLFHFVAECICLLAACSTLQTAVRYTVGCPSWVAEHLVLGILFYSASLKPNIRSGMIKLGCFFSDQTCRIALSVTRCMQSLVRAVPSTLSGSEYHDIFEHMRVRNALVYTEMTPDAQPAHLIICFMAIIAIKILQDPRLSALPGFIPELEVAIVTTALIHLNLRFLRAVDARINNMIVRNWPAIISQTKKTTWAKICSPVTIA